MRPDKTKVFLRCLRGRPDAELQTVAAAMINAAAVFGQPHLHVGRGLRDLGQGFYECRVSLELQLVFFREGDALLFDFAGNHNGVRAYLKNR